MDTLPFATAVLSFKSWKYPAATGCPAPLNSMGQTLWRPNPLHQSDASGKK